MNKLSLVLVVLGLLAMFQSAVAGDPGTTTGIIDIGKPERPADTVTLAGTDGYNLIPEGDAPTKWFWQEQADRCTELAREILPKQPQAKGGKGKCAKVEK